MRSRRRIRLICRWAGVVILMLWITSFVITMQIAWPARSMSLISPSEHNENSVTASNGLLYWYWEIGPAPSHGVRVSILRSADRRHWRWRVYLIGVWFAEMWGGSTVIFPATVPIGLSAALIGLSLRRRYPNGHCPKCGYDLTGIADKCPECGCAVKA